MRIKIPMVLGVLLFLVCLIGWLVWYAPWSARVKQSTDQESSDQELLDPALFIKVVEENGIYWFRKGDLRFLATGVNVVQPKDETETPDGKYYNVLEKYNHVTDAWAQDVTLRLKKWGFNTVSAWSSEALYRTGDFFHTRVIWFGGIRKKVDLRLVDVFSPEYVAAIDATAKKEVRPHATNDQLIGYFINNELPWYGEHGWFTSSLISLLSRYMELPRHAPGKLRLVQFLRETYGDDFSALSRDWVVKTSSFEELLRETSLQPNAKVCQKYIAEWAGVVADRYYSLCRNAIRRYDKHHLILGSRFNFRAHASVMKACGKYCDVISINQYQKDGRFDAKTIGAVYALTQRPVMITEFSWRAEENSSGCANRYGADVTVSTQADRAAACKRFCTAAVSLPYVLGYDWFQYADQPPSGRFDGEDSNYGLLDIYDQPYEELVKAISEVNQMAGELHRRSDTARKLPDPLILSDYREIKVRHDDQTLESPVLYASMGCTTLTWGVATNGASIQIDESQANMFILQVETGEGWGCGVTFKPHSVIQDSFGIADVSGAHQVRVRADINRPIIFNMGLNERGYGSEASELAQLSSDTADGECYRHLDILSTNGWYEYAFDLRKMEQNVYHGNQQGNKVIDTDSVDSLDLYFPGKQGSFTMALEWIKAY